jgi:radical SAM superfamily enzyme YgiQ (UPF0313 family)
VTSLPDEAAAHAGHVFLGPGEDTWPRFLEDLRQGTPAPRYESRERTLGGLPPIRRDLIKRHLYLVPNSIVVSRGCPHVCDFCYKVAFFKGGRQFYTQRADEALAEIDRLPGRHLYFLDDHLFGSPPFAEALFEGMRGMGRLWQAAGTVKAVLEQPRALEKVVDSGLRSLFVGFETVNAGNLGEQRKYQNQGRDYGAAVRRLRSMGVMVNGSFVFGMDQDGPDVFERTVDWAVEQGIETATFHILTPYPDTATYRRMEAEGRMLHRDWDLYDTRHVVFRPRGPDGGGAGGRLLAGLPGLLPLGVDLAVRVRQVEPARAPQAPGLRRRVEEVRAPVGPRHPLPPGPARPAAAGGGARLDAPAADEEGRGPGPAPRSLAPSGSLGQ